MTLQASLFILVISIVANGCASAHFDESRNKAGQSVIATPVHPQASIGLTNAAQNLANTLVKYFVETRMAEVKPELSLTPGQELEIRKILTRQASAFFETLPKIFNGELSQKELDEAEKQQTNCREQIKSLLTAQQATAYDELKREQQKRQAQEIAAAELRQLQSSLQLKNDQPDKIFVILAKQAEAYLSNLETNAAVVLSDRAQSGNNIEALRDVLTPVQYKRYQKLLEQQSHPDQSFFQLVLQAVVPAVNSLNFKQGQ